MATLRRRLAFLAMVLVTLVVAHDLVFLLAYGSAYDAALARTGHDGAWDATVVVVLFAAAGLFGLATLRLYRLGIVARSLGPTEGQLSPDAHMFGRRLLGLWSRLSLVVTLVFALLENVEHLRAGEQLPGLTVIGSPEYPDAALVIMTVALVVAFVGALFRWGRDRLLAVIAIAVRNLRQRGSLAARRPPSIPDVRPPSLVGRGFAVRAPPSPAR